MTITEILADARRLVKANTTSLPTADAIEIANRELERVVGKIRQAQGRWQWDDFNETDFAIATTGLTANIQDYSLDVTHYRIERVEVRDTDGKWRKLTPFDQVDIYDQSLTDFLNTAGLPQCYDKVGNSLFLYPKPNYTDATPTDGSLKVFYERGTDYFLTSDTIKTPGFNPLFHRLISMGIALDYAIINDLKAVNNIASRILVMEDELATYYALRDEDEHLTLRTRLHSFK